jgi:hypothetical protein
LVRFTHPANYILLTAASALSVALNTDLSSPPRFDGAGYAVLGEALAAGRGYREIDVPGAPRHAHFPPGYPAALALLWRAFGRSAPAAHVFSAACTVAAVLLAWRWFRRLYPPRTALILGLALALNWTWARNGGAIQSEPLYLVWELIAVRAASRAGASRGGRGAGIILGFVLAACVLTRHVGVCLVAAAAIDLAMRRRWRELSGALLTVAILVFPWIVWLAVVRHNTQVGMLTREDLPARFAAQSWFYLQRLPDQITGPFVEVATVFQRRPAITLMANVWAMTATAVVIWGWVRTLRTPRRRLAGLIALATLPLLAAWPFTEAGRLLVPLLPFVLVGAIEGIAALLALRAPRRARRWTALILLTVSVPYNAYSILSGRAGAQRGTHAGFDAACLWITEHATRPGPVLFRHPGEVFWQTGRQAVAPDSPDPDAIARLIDRFGVAYLLIDDDRYARAGPSPLGRYVERFPDHVALVWQADPGPAQVRVYEVLRGHRIAPGRGAN